MFLDIAGFCFSKQGEEYHWDEFSDINIPAARREIKKRIAMRKQMRRINRLIKTSGDKLVTVEDSVRAGNCESGTNQFLNNTVMPAVRKRIKGIKN